MKPKNCLTNLEKVIPCPWLSQLKPYTPQETFLDYLVNHYALMAMNPATINHARHMTKLLTKDFPTLNTLIVQRLKVLHEQRRLSASAKNG
jgi:hypothetical protein